MQEASVINTEPDRDDPLWKEMEEVVQASSQEMGSRVLESEKDNTNRQVSDRRSFDSGLGSSLSLTPQQGVKTLEQTK